MQKQTNPRTMRPQQHLIGMPQFKFSHSAADLNTKNSLQYQTINDRLDSQLAQNIALILLDKNFEHIESHALHTLTSITKDFILEIGKEVKANTEGQGRSDANLCDMMNTAYDYSMSQQELVDHMQSKELTLAPMQQHLA